MIIFRFIMVLILEMIDSIVLDNVMEKIHPKCNRKIVIIDGNNVGFWEIITYYPT